jgi:hypothetical protein
VEVEFRPNNDPDEDPIALPTLVLFRDGVLTDDPDERTIVVGVRDASVAAPDGVVKPTLIVRTQHGDPDQGGDQSLAPFFTVLTDTQVVSVTPSTDGTAVASVEFSSAFGATVEAMSGTTLIEIDTPTDYYWVDLELNGVSYLPINDYAFLMENEYGVDLGTDQQGTGFTGRAYHCDMFPIGGGDPSSWLPRQDADDHVQNWLLPAMHSTFQMEVNDWAWGPLHEDWDDDGVLELYYGNGQDWYHRRSGQRFHPGDDIAISLIANTGRGAFQTFRDQRTSTLVHVAAPLRQVCRGEAGAGPGGRGSPGSLSPGWVAGRQ